MKYDYQKYKKLGISFDYSELLAEFISDYNEELIGEYVFIKRGLTYQGYENIIDWFFSEKELQADEGYHLELTRDVIEEMQEMSKVV